MIQPPEITENKLIKYINNHQLFREEQFVMEATEQYPEGVLFGDVCQNWQKEYIFDPIDAKDKNGFPKYQLIYIGMPKKMGKTSVIAGQCVIQLLLSPRTTKENYLLGGDKDQANYLFEQTKSFIERNPNFDGLFTILKNEVIVNSTGAKLTILSSEAKTKHGKNPDLFIIDEFWNQPNRELWDSMWLGLAAKPSGQAIIITNAGTDKTSICYKIRE